MSDTTDPAVNEPVVTQDTTATESAPVETKAPEVADSFDEVWDDELQTPETKSVEPKAETDSQEAPADTDQPAEEQAPADETPAEEQPRGKAEERKQQLNAEIRDLVAQRNALKTEVEQANAQVYAPETVDALVEQGYSELEAKVEAMQQQQAIERYNNQVTEAQLTLESESTRVINDFPIFNATSDQYKPELAQKAADLLAENLVVDPNTGQVVGSKISPYKLYETIAAAHSTSVVEGQLQGQRATEKMLANADSTSNAAPPKPKADPILDVWKD